MASVWGELKRRNVVKVAVAYAIVGWLLVEVATTVLPVFEAPTWIAQVFTFFVILGFPLVLILSWAYEITPEGIQLERNVAAGESITHVTGRKLDFAIIGALVLALGFVVYNYVLVDSDQETVVQETPLTAEQAAESPPPVVEEQREVLPNSVAVLPFENLSPDPDNAYFAAGIHESTLNQLAKIRDLSVIARTSVMQYEDNPPPIPEIAEALNVEMVMEGSVRYANGRVLITAQLIDGRTGIHLWSDEYDRDLADVFAVQADIATRIAMALEAEFSLEEQQRIERVPTDSLEAYALYLRALELIAPRPGADNASALSLLQEAVEIDPGFAIAHARIANLYFNVDRERLATASAQRALEIDPDLGYAYITLAEIHRSRLEGIGAREDYDRAIALSPNDSNVLTEYALFRSETMQHVDAVRLAQHGVELDPNNPSYQNRLAKVLDRAGNFESAVIVWLSAGGPLSARMSRIHSEISSGSNDAALADLRDLETIQIETTDTSFRSQWLHAQIAYAYSRLGRREDAVRIADQITEIPAPVLAYLAVGDHGAALDRLNQLAEIQVQLAQSLATSAARDALFDTKANPWKDPILDQPEFVEVRSRLGFRE